MTQPKILYVTDLTYEARGRRYCDEDIYLTSELRDGFRLAACHPRDARFLMNEYDAVVVRNSGPVAKYPADYEAFRDSATKASARVYNPLGGKADMAGKQYLLDLSAAGFPVIPTVDRPERLGELGDAPDGYVCKPKLGADSAGLFRVGRDETAKLVFDETLVQPFVDFEYEVSFYFVDDAFQYALFAPDPDRRWELIRYVPTPDDLAFARRFLEWNGLPCGIQRVDACRTRSGELLLVELEDLNPYLSLDRLDEKTRGRFVEAFRSSLLTFLRN